jgi:chitinase
VSRRIVLLAWCALAIPACSPDTSPDGGEPPPAGPPPAVNRPPTVRLAAPGDDTIVQNGVALDLVAVAQDPDGSVVQVSFFEGATLLATVLTSPFQFTWIPVIDGTFSLAAVATDSSAAVVSSDPVRVIVQTPGTSPDPTPPNQPPVVRITNPLDGAVFVEGSSISLTADASDPDGPSLRVEFFDGTTSIGTATLIPFLVSWSGASPGPHSIRAVATDAVGGSTASVPVSITVTRSSSPPTTKEARRRVWSPPLAEGRP